MANEQQAFAGLPAGLVEEVLGQTEVAGEQILDSLHTLHRDRSNLRQALMDRQLILHESNLGYPPVPTTCGVDGSYAIERLLTVDLVAAAAVAVEGLTPPSEQRYWQQPHHATFVASEPHDADTSTVLRAVMLGRELQLAARAPHQVIMIDGTLTLPIIYFNQAINKAPEAPHLTCSQTLLNEVVAYAEAYLHILRSTRTDQNFIGLPKYSTRKEIGRLAGWPGNHDDRGLLTMILQPGEFTRPLQLEAPQQPWHLNLGRLPHHTRKAVATYTDQIVACLDRIHVVYYRPHGWLPALRIEGAASVMTNSHRLAAVIQAVKHQCATPAMLEPYPTYWADRIVKALSKSLPTFRQVATQHVSQRFDGEILEVFFSMHGYRSETGG